ncbi:TatD family hydrolase [Carboxylicivirga taeanensis]|uniref:TatD family hydrolase n=1 Tax=Carboxylicivirga taeanensis TaxID=1416875 RepID=UPI003F6E1CAF
MLINFHTHHPRNQTNLIQIVNRPICEIISDHAPSYKSTGIHPWDINNSTTIIDLEVKVSQKNVVAIGECGLDKLKGPDLAIQKEIFIAQIELAEQLKKPLIIHCVKAYSEIIKLRKDIQPAQAWIFHGFNAPKETMEQALKQGFYFSVGEALLKKNSKVSQSLPFIPHNRLFLETDNNPQLRIESIYEKASQLLNLEIIQLQNIIQDNFKHLFNVDTRIHQPLK